MSGGDLDQKAIDQQGAREFGLVSGGYAGYVGNLERIALPREEQHSIAMIGTGGDERLRELQSDAATQSQDTRVERLVASKPAGLRYGSAARHIVDETPGGKIGRAPV